MDTMGDGSQTLRAAPLGADSRADRRDSLSMFQEVVVQAMDDGYLEASAARGGGPPPRTWRRHVALLAALAVLATLLTVAAKQTQAREPVLAAEKQHLVDRIHSQTAHVDALHARAEDLQQEVSRIQSETLEQSTQGQSLQDRIAALELLTGATRATGPGLRIVVDDGPAQTQDGQANDAGRILDLDLQYLVNGLWLAGAEAIAINGQRLTTLTAIRGADRSITVGYRPLARPYVVEVIGDPRTLESRFVETPAGAWFEKLRSAHHVGFDVTTQESLVLPADSLTQLRYVRTETHS